MNEPTAGLDPTERNRFFDLLSEIGENVVVILSIHIVEDVTERCPNMAIIAQGEVVATGSPNDVIGEICGKVYRTKTEKAALVQLREQHEVISSKLVAGQPVVRVFSETALNEGFQPETELVTPAAAGLRRSPQEFGPGLGRWQLWQLVKMQFMNVVRAWLFRVLALLGILFVLFNAYYIYQDPRGIQMPATYL